MLLDSLLRTCGMQPAPGQVFSYVAPPMPVLCACGERLEISSDLAIPARNFTRQAMLRLSVRHPRPVCKAFYRWLDPQAVT